MLELREAIGGFKRHLDIGTSNLYIVVSIVICLPSILAWRIEPFTIGAREFDPFLGQFGTVAIGRVFHSVGFLLLGLLYSEIMHTRRALPHWEILWVGVVWLISVPWISPDVFFYVAKGWIEEAYRANPFSTSIEQIPGHRNDLVFASVVEALKPVVGNYGPRFQDISRIVAKIADGSPRIGLACFKFLSLVALLTICRLISEFKRIEAAEARRWVFLNPLLVASFLGAAHNDVFATMLMLGGALFSTLRKPLLSGVAMGLAISFKPTSALILPVLLAAPAAGHSLRFVFVRENLYLTIGVLAGLVLGFIGRPEALLVYVSYANGDAPFRATLLALFEPLARWLGVSTNVYLNFGRVLFVCVGVTRLRSNLIKASNDRTDFVLRSAFELLVLGQLLALQMMNEWYLLWPFAFALAWNRKRALAWLMQLSIVYMPLVIWGIVGSPIVNYTVQAIITASFTLSTFFYFKGESYETSHQTRKPSTT